MLLKSLRLTPIPDILSLPQAAPLSSVKMTSNNEPMLEALEETIQETQQHPPRQVPLYLLPAFLPLDTTMLEPSRETMPTPRISYVDSKSISVECEAIIPRTPTKFIMQSVAWKDSPSIGSPLFPIARTHSPRGLGSLLRHVQAELDTSYGGYECF